MARLAQFESVVIKMDGYTSCYDKDQMRYKGIEAFYPLRDLFLWALLLGKIEMSFVIFRYALVGKFGKLFFFHFFSRIDLGLCSSLAAIRILKGLSEYSDNEGQKALMLSYARKESI